MSPWSDKSVVIVADSSPQKKKKEEKEEGKGEKHLCPSANFHLFDRMERDPRSAKNNRQIKPSAKSNPSRPPISHEKRSSSIVVGNQGNKPPPFNDSIFMPARELHRLFGDIYIYTYLYTRRSRLCEYLPQNDFISIQFYTSNVYFLGWCNTADQRSVSWDGCCWYAKERRYRREGRTDILYHREEGARSCKEDRMINKRVFQLAGGVTCRFFESNQQRSLCRVSLSPPSHSLSF